MKVGTTFIDFAPGEEAPRVSNGAGNLLSLTLSSQSRGFSD